MTSIHGCGCEWASFDQGYRLAGTARGRVGRGLSGPERGADERRTRHRAAGATLDANQVLHLQPLINAAHEPGHKKIREF
jgi:hypothetical protein